MINITDTKYQEKELKDLLENAGKTLDTAGVIAVKNAYVKGIDRGHWQIEHLVETHVIDDLESVQANIWALKSYITDESCIPSEKAVDYILIGMSKQLENVIRALGYKGVND